MQLRNTVVGFKSVPEQLKTRLLTWWHQVSEFVHDQRDYTAGVQ